MIKIKPMRVFFLTMLIIVGCGYHDKVFKATQPVIITSALPVVPIEPIAVTRGDTIHSHYLSDTPRVVIVRHPEKVLIKEGILPTYDSLLRDHLSLSKHYLRAVDTARERKKRLDSSAIRDIVLNKKLDRIIKNQKYVQDKADKSDLDRSLTKKEVWIGFAILMIIGLFNSYYSVRNRHKQKLVHGIK